MMERQGGVTGPVGNDIIDLAHARCRGKTDDERFLARVFTARERARIREADDPARTLWLHWAAKETAFKVVTKLQGAPPPFVHAAFQVEVPPGDAGGSVRYGDHTVWWVEDRRSAAGCLHVVGWAGDRSPGAGATAVDQGATAVDQGVARLPDGAGIPSERFTELELSAVRSAASAWVRIHARAHLARLLGQPESEVQIVSGPGDPGRSPPLALVGGTPSGWDVSLSHHGRWVAWALAPGGEGPPSGAQNVGR